jgi:glutamate/aspartate transport system substrate-binding protein
MCRLLPAALAVLSLLVLGGPRAACAQDATEAGLLAGTLAKVKASRAVGLGYRQASVPFSYVTPSGQPVGYSLDLCDRIVDAIRAALGDEGIAVRYVAVDTRTRIPRLLDGTIDLECGTTTNTAERRAQVAFSPVIFLSGTKLAIRRSSAVRSYKDLRGRSVVATPASTNEATIAALDARERLGIALVSAPDVAQAFEMLRSGGADAWAGDDVVLLATLAQSGDRQRYVVLDPFLSYDPYGIAYRANDAQLAALVRRTFEQLAQSRELARIYEQWFQRRLPAGTVLGLPMSAQLQAIFESLGQPTE